MSVYTIFLAALATAAVLCALGAQADYTAGAAMSALQFAKASYCNASEIQSWKCASCTAHPSFSAPRVYSDKAAGTQAYIGLGEGHVVVAFRGSQNKKNWLNNLAFVRKQYSNSNCNNCSVHTGFLESYNSLKTQLLQGVRELIDAHPSHSILVTGHSLGGAMATLAAADIAQFQYSSGAKPHIDLYTFGSPRLGNQNFANWFANLFCSGGHASHRVAHKSDMVTHVPPSMMGFVHVSREYYYNNDGNAEWTNCHDVSGSTCTDQKVKEDEKCGKTTVKRSTSDHLLYLGICTSCSCETGVTDSDGSTEPSSPNASVIQTAARVPKPTKTSTTKTKARAETQTAATSAPENSTDTQTPGAKTGSGSLYSSSSGSAPLKQKDVRGAPHQFQTQPTAPPPTLPASPSDLLPAKDDAGEKQHDGGPRVFVAWNCVALLAVLIALW